jgi:Ser/Thr protein kinase RdoA (MazF antagonist)
VVRVEAEGRIAFLKEYPAALRERIVGTVGLAERLRALGVTAPSFCRTGDGATCALIGDRMFTLGRSVGASSLWQAPLAADPGRVPRFLAELHAALGVAGAGWDEPVCEPPAMWHSFDQLARVEGLAAQFARAGHAEGDRFLEALDRLRDLDLSVLALHRLPAATGLVHGDFWPGNVIRRRDGFGIVDLDNAFRAPLLLDVAQYVDLGFARHARDVKVGLDLGQATRFALRYADHAGFGRDALAVLPDVLIAARICSILWILERHVRSGPSPLDVLVDNDARTLAFLQSHAGEWRERLAG